MNGKLLIDNWTNHANTGNSGTISLLANQEYELKLEYYENGGGAEIHLWWLPPGGTYQVIPSTNLLAPATVTANSTIYIGGMYEEDVTPGSTVTQYTSYYSFGGKLVGMRKVLGTPGNTTSTQYRIVADHLGSTSVIVDAQNTPVVVQRTFNKPYGEVAWSWSPSGGGPTSLTSIGYTGQRLEGGPGESGLMDYGARFYDPALSFFVSADTVAPSKGDSKTRNRFSYVRNNPLKFTDPSGHQALPPEDTIPDYPPGEDVPGNIPTGDCQTGDEANRARCQDQVNALAEYGLQVPNIGSWNWKELVWVLEAIQRLCLYAVWTPNQFRAAMGIDYSKPETLITLDRQHVGYEGSVQKPDYEGLSTSARQGDGPRIYRHLILYDKALNGGEIHFKSVVVHEFAHQWDMARNGELSNGMAYDVARYAPGERSVSQYGRDGGAGEDWAEVVASIIYPEDPRFDTFSRTRWTYVWGNFYAIAGTVRP